MEHEDFDDYDEGGFTCNRCDGEGRLMVCCDDICRGSDRCMYTPERRNCFCTCPECNGSGEVA